MNPALFIQVFDRDTHFRLAQIGPALDLSGRCLRGIHKEYQSLRYRPSCTDFYEEIDKFFLLLGEYQNTSLFHRSPVSGLLSLAFYFYVKAIPVEQKKLTVRDSSHKLWDNWSAHLYRIVFQALLPQDLTTVQTVSGQFFRLCRNDCLLTV